MNAEEKKLKEDLEKELERLEKEFKEIDDESANQDIQ